MAMCQRQLEYSSSRHAITIDAMHADDGVMVTNLLVR
jgi:hypothetical protein